MPGAARPAGEKAGELFRSVQLDYAMSTQTVFYIMAGVMAVCFVVALIWSPSGRMEEIVLDGGEDETG